MLCIHLEKETEEPNESSLDYCVSNVVIYLIYHILHIMKCLRKANYLSTKVIIVY